MGGSTVGVGRARRVDPDRMARGWLRGDPRACPVPHARGAGRVGTRDRRRGAPRAHGPGPACAPPGALPGRLRPLDAPAHWPARQRPHHVPSAQGHTATRRMTRTWQDPRHRDVGRHRSAAAGGTCPRPPGQPARMSVLMLPARGLDARFVIPCVSSAVHGNVRERPEVRLGSIAFLRPHPGWRRSLMATGGITSTHSLHLAGNGANHLFRVARAVHGLRWSLRGPAASSSAPRATGLPPDAVGHGDLPSATGWWSHGRRPSARTLPSVRVVTGHRM